MSNHKKNKTFLQTYLVSFSFFFSHIHTHAQKGGAALFSSAMKRSERTGDLVAGVTGLLHLDTITNKPLEREHDRQRVGRSWRWTTLSSASGDVRKYLHDRWCVCRWRDSVLNLHDSRTQRSLLNPDVRQRHRSSVTHTDAKFHAVCVCVVSAEHLIYSAARLFSDVAAVLRCCLFTEDSVFAVFVAFFFTFAAHVVQSVFNSTMTA